MQKPCVIFDFDNTLFDTETIKEYFWKIASIHDFSPAEILVLYRAAREADGHITITVESFLTVLKNELAQQGKVFLDRQVYEIINEMENAEGLLPGAQRLLEFCQREQFPRYLLSLGVAKWQAQKVRRSGVEHYFEKDKIIFTSNIAEGKKEVLKQLFGRSFNGARTVLFNDKPDETAELLTAFPKLGAFLRREVRDGRYGADDFQSLAKQFPGRVFWSETLDELTTVFKKLI
jgi:phosphoglycolate phosphatase-like HAD superfamily hydrolase